MNEEETKLSKEAYEKLTGHLQNLEKDYAKKIQEIFERIKEAKLKKIKDDLGLPDNT